MQPRKIVILNFKDVAHPEAGGAERYLFELASRWVRLGHQVTWLTSRFSNAQSVETIAGIQVRRVGSRLTVYVRAVLEYLRLESHDLVIDVENGIPFFSPLYVRKPVILLVFHVHTTVWRQELPLFASSVGRFLETRCMPICFRKNRIVTISEGSAKQLRSLMKNTIDIVPCGVNDQLGPGKEKSPTPLVLFVGRLKRYKSIDVLLQAMKMLERDDVQLEVVGEGDDKTRLQQFAQDLGLQNVRFLGHLDEAQKTRRLQRSWLLVNPSSAEGWGMCNTEASACGTAVIASRIPGNQDSVQENKTGLLFRQNSAVDLASKMNLVLQQDQLRYRLQNGGIQWAQNFDWDTSAKLFLNVIENVIANESHA